MPTITKRDLIVRITDKTGLTQSQVSSVVQELLEQIIHHVGSGDPVVLRKFGVFERRINKPKIGRNPKEPSKNMVIPARSVARFRPGKEMKLKVSQLPFTAP